MVHIEKLIENASIVKRGPNYFLALKVENNETVYINEWMPQEQRQAFSYRGKEGQELLTHFGKFTTETIKALPNQVLVCDARPHKEDPTMLFFTTNVKFEPTDDGAQAFLVNQEEKQKATPEAVVEPVQEVPKIDSEVPAPMQETTPEAVPVKKARKVCPICHKFMGKDGHKCK